MYFRIFLLFSLFFVLGCNGQNYSLAFIHTADIRANILPVDDNNAACSPYGEFFLSFFQYLYIKLDIAAQNCTGGSSRLAAFVNMTRQNYPNVVVFDGGDEFEGTLYFQIYDATVTEFVMNTIKYDCMALGTHEFDLGDAYLLQFLADVNFPVVSANLDEIVSIASFFFFFLFIS